MRFDLFDNQEKSRKIFSALQKIADGSETETIKGLRDDLSEYGGTNDITFYWGNEKKGIYHIAYRRGVNTLLHVIDAVADGRVLRYVEGNKTVVLEKDGFEAVLALTEYGEKKSWLLSGWKTGKPDAISEVGTQSDATQSRPTFSRQELGAGLRDIISQNSENSSDGTENNGELRTGTDGSDGLRFSISEYSAEEVRDYVDTLKPFTGTVIDRNPEDYAAYLKEHGVDIPEKDAFRFAQEAARKKMKQARKAADKEAAKQLKLKSLSSILSIWSTRSIKCLSVSNKILTKKDCLIQTVKTRSRIFIRRSVCRCRSARWKR